MKQRFVLDAWAILAFLQKEEPAASRVKGLLEEAEKGNVELFISVINLGEVAYCIGKVKGENAAETTLNEIRRLALTVVPATEEAVFAAARFKMRHAISYADSFAAAAAEELGAALATGDPELEQLAYRIRIEKLERSETA
ncbi:MAG: type II toxin-antitoxin system VapC family toxin [Chloroflexi bacterium]|nr:type II toxin-antitoxin system VapC family toxin [Chloroflexota bacterium]